MPFGPCQLPLPVEELSRVPLARPSLATVLPLHDVPVLQSHGVVVPDFLVQLSTSPPPLSVVAASTLLAVVVPLVLLAELVLVHDGLGLAPPFVFAQFLLAHVANPRMQNHS